MNISKSQQIQEELLPDNLLTRFLFSKSNEINIAERYIRTSAFSDKHPKGYSVFETTDLSHDDIWTIGKKEVADKRKDKKPMLGRFDLEVKHYLRVRLNIKKNEPPPRHYDIFGMPIPANQIGEELSERQILANEASKKIYLITDIPTWSKYR